MTYKKLKEIIKENKKFQEEIYISNFLTGDPEMFCNTRISIYRTISNTYVVTKWRDYEDGRFEEQQCFKDKDLAVDYAWKLFGGDEEFKKFLEKNK